MAHGFKSVLIAGAGTMGRSIAELMTQSGFEVQLWDIDPAALGRASAAIERSLKRQFAIGRITEITLDRSLERIRLISDLKVLNKKTDLVIETIVEELDPKRRFFQTIESQLPEAWYISHSSVLSISRLSELMKRPDRLIGMHFFNPAPVIPLVEIVYGSKTNKLWIQSAIKFVEERLGKQSIVVRESPGVVSGRLGLSMALEAMRMLEQEVASVEDIDKAMVYGFRHPMGPLKQSDWIGLDVRLRCAQILYAELKSDVFKPPEILKRMVELGKLGKKSGQGFYEWPKDTTSFW